MAGKGERTIAYERIMNPTQHMHKFMVIEQLNATYAPRCGEWT